MLFLADPGLPGPTAKKLAQYQAEIDALDGYASQVAEAKKKFASRSSRANSTFRVVREQLSVMCTGAQRCVYCEDSVGDEVEHVKPKDLYPQAVFSWVNFVYACGPCNGAKNNKFSVITPSGRVDVTRPRGAPVIPPTPGEPAFINPRKDDPLALLTIDLCGTFFMLPRDGLTTQQIDRADFTIDTLNLNRDLLLEARWNAYGGYRARLREYRSRRDAGAGPVELQALRLGLSATPHPTVWEEMKLQAADVPHIHELFAGIPEALEWRHVA